MKLDANTTSPLNQTNELSNIEKQIVVTDETLDSARLQIEQLKQRIMDISNGTYEKKLEANVDENAIVAEVKEAVKTRNTLQRLKQTGELCTLSFLIRECDAVVFSIVMY